MIVPHLPNRLLKPLCGHRKEQVKDFAFVVRRRAKSHRRPTNGSRLSAVRSPIERRALRRINRVTRSCCVATYAGRRKFYCGTVGDSRPINEHRTGHLRELGFLRRFAAARRCGLVLKPKSRRPSSPPCMPLRLLPTVSGESHLQPPCLPPARSWPTRQPGPPLQTDRYLPGS